jgi:hypothetical protein
MGLKSGSRDAGLDDSEEEKESVESKEHERRRETQEQEKVEKARAEEQEPKEPAVEREPVQDSTSATGSESTAGGESSAGQQTMSSIPYKLRRDKVNEGREQVPYFLREEVIEAEDEFQDTLEELVGEDVYKSDYREASMVVAQRNPELVAEVLREWGYDLDSL